MGVPKLPENGISWALYVGDFLLEGVSQWTPFPNGPQSPLCTVTVWRGGRGYLKILAVVIAKFRS